MKKFVAGMRSVASDIWSFFPLPASDRGPQGGFTLVEMIVAVALFTTVMLVAVSALLSLINANRKAQALQSVMNNLNIAVDGMVRSVRMGTLYHCGAANYNAENLTTADCAGGGTFLAFRPFAEDGEPNPSPWLYWYAEDEHGIGRLYKSVDGSISSGIPITAPEVSIDLVRFYVVGSDRGDSVQPKVLIVIRGSSGNVLQRTRTTFHIQATAVQRVLDI